MTAPEAAASGETPAGSPPDLPPVVVSLQVGRPALHVTRSGREFLTGFWKSPVDESKWLSATGLDGDGQGDLVHHGGPHKAILLYAAAHYPTWATELDTEPYPYGGFGENATVGGLTEADVCIGDIWQLGGAVVQVSQPRQPCWKLDVRWDRDDLVRRAEANGRTGWYHRVLGEGLVGRGDRLELLDRPRPEWSVARANELMHHRRHDRALAAELSAVPELSPNWHRTLAARAAGVDEDVAARRAGRN